MVHTKKENYPITGYERALRGSRMLGLPRIDKCSTYLHKKCWTCLHKKCSTCLHKKCSTCLHKNVQHVFTKNVKRVFTKMFNMSSQKNVQHVFTKSKFYVPRRGKLKTIKSRDRNTSLLNMGMNTAILPLP